MRNFRGKLLEKILRTPFKTFTEKGIGTSKRSCYHLCILSGENINTTKDFSLVVFFCRWELTKASLV